MMVVIAKHEVEMNGKKTIAWSYEIEYGPAAGKRYSMCNGEVV